MVNGRPLYGGPWSPVISVSGQLDSVRGVPLCVGHCDRFSEAEAGLRHIWVGRGLNSTRICDRELENKVDPVLRDWNHILS